MSRKQPKLKISTRKILAIVGISVTLMIMAAALLHGNSFSDYVFVLVLGAAYAAAGLWLGWAKDPHTREKNVVLLTTVLSCLFQTITFVFFGIKVGFVRTVFQPGLAHFFIILVPSIAALCLSELLRYQLVDKGRSSKLAIASIILLFTIVDLCINSYSFDFSSAKGIFKILSINLFPAIVKNFFLTYVAFHYSDLPCLIYRGIMEVPALILPIMPDLDNFLVSVLGVVCPFLLMLAIMSYTENTELRRRFKDRFPELKRTQYLRLAGNITVTIIVVIFAGLMSGIFKYYFLAIGSGSMEPEIFIGDMVLVEKRDDPEHINIGDVLVYHHEDQILLHRIVDIDDSSGSRTFKTKGDANDTVDPWTIPSTDIIGITKFKLAKIGYPTIWINNILKGGNQ